MTERHSDPLVDRFDEAYVVEKTVDLVHGDDTYRIEIVRDLKHRGAGSRYKARYFRQEPKGTGHVWVTTPELPWVDVEGVDPNGALRQAASFLADRLRRR